MHTFVPPTFCELPQEVTSLLQNMDDADNDDEDGDEDVTFA